MNNFEQPNPLPSAERRKHKAEESGDLSISHWEGNLHTHTKTSHSHPHMPEDVIETRRGSNCGKIPLDLLIQYHEQKLGNTFVGITDHSRDASPKIAEDGVTDWFNTMYLSNDEWLRQKFGKTLGELTDEDRTSIKAMAFEEAKKIAHYGDERLEQVQSDIDSFVETKSSIRVLKGVEVSVLPDGSFDTPMVKAGKFELVAASIHPNVDPEGFKPIITDPEKYTDLAVKTIEHPETNSISHIGFGTAENFNEGLDWTRIAQAAVDNKVAIEINLKELMRYIYHETLDYQKHGNEDLDYRQQLEQQLPRLIPIISSPHIRDQLRPFISDGLSFAINTDEHENPYVEAEVTRETIVSKTKNHEFRYWRALKIVEQYFNRAFDDLGVTKANIINTYSVGQLERFLKKE